MRGVLLFLIVGVALILQATVFDFIRILGAKPDLIMLIVIFYGFIHGPREGAYLGFLAGLLMDFATGHYIGLNALSKMAVGYLAGMGEERLYQENTFIAVFVAMAGTLVGQTINFLLLLMVGIKISVGSALLTVILPVTFYNGLLTPFLYGLFYRSNTRGLLKTPDL